MASAGILITRMSLKYDRAKEWSVIIKGLTIMRMMKQRYGLLVGYFSMFATLS